MKSELFRLAKNLLALGVIAALGFAGYQYFFSENEEGQKIDDTPIHIESIKTIAEISTVSYKDEVVMDSTEFHKQRNSLYDPREWMRMYDRNIKRRLTLIVKGEVKYGVDLTNGKYSVESDSKTIWLRLPEPKIIDVLVMPSKTEVFIEKGTWSDQARTSMEMQAKLKLKENAKLLKLDEKARENAQRLFEKLIISDKKIIISFDYEK
ncbi:MAG: DUF4230 domain-containing protein [Fluviicola sp.]|nr:DUF4230 domain-containing protein [Fluviicola sp.]